MLIPIIYRFIALFVVSLVCYVATFALSGLLFHFFTPSGQDCGTNMFFIVMTLIVVFVFAIISLHPAVSFCTFAYSSFFLFYHILLFYVAIEDGRSCLFIIYQIKNSFTNDMIAFLLLNQVNGSIMPASIISLYCMYLCYSGLASEPRDYACNGLHNHSKAVSTGTLTLGLLTTVLSVVYSAVRAGSSTTLLSTPSSPRAGAQFTTHTHTHIFSPDFCIIMGCFSFPF